MGCILAEDLEPFLERVAVESGRQMPAFVRDQLRAMVSCGDFTRGFSRFECTECRAPRVVPHRCKSRLCPSCSGRRMSEQAAHLVDRVLSSQAPYRQWVLTLPWDLARAVAYDRSLCIAVLAVFASELRRWHEARAADVGVTGAAGCVMELQRFADGAGLFPHAHALAPQGVFVEHPDHSVTFRRVRAPNEADVLAVVTRVEVRVRKMLKRRGRLTDEESAVDDSTSESDSRLMLRCADASPTRKERAAAPSPPRSGPASTRTRRRPKLCQRSPAGFETHAARLVRAGDTDALEQACAYMSRPAIPRDRHSGTSCARPSAGRPATRLVPRDVSGTTAWWSSF